MRVRELQSKVKYVFFENSTKLPGKEFILCLQEPFIVCSVVYFDNYEEVARATSIIENWLPYIAVPGYNICVWYCGSLNNPNLSPLMFQQVRSILNEMAVFYLEDRILNNTERYSGCISSIH